MNIENEYYKKICYKKNAFDDLSIKLKMSYMYKNVYIISTKSIELKYITKIMNSLSVAEINFKTFIAKNNFDKNECFCLSEKLIKDKCDLIIALGGGTCCDVAKYFAYNMEIEYIVCPTTISSLSYFTNYCINPFDSTKSFYANFPLKIYIAESIVKETNQILFENSMWSISSYISILLDVVFSGEEKTDIYEQFYKIFVRFFGELNFIKSNNQDGRLVLMDILIDLGYLMLDINFNNCSLINLYCLVRKISDTNNGNLLSMCASLLIHSQGKYVNGQKKNFYEIPDYLQVADYIKKYKINIKNIKNKKYFDNFLEKFHKNYNFCGFWANKKIKLKQIREIYLLINNELKLFKGKLKIEDFDKLCLFKSFKILPFVCECNDAIKYMGAVGVLNNF